MIDLKKMPEWESKLTKEFVDFVREHENLTYNDRIEKAYIQKLNLALDEQEKDVLGRCVYIARDLLSKEREQQRADKLKEAGFIPLTSEIVKQAFETKKRLQVVAKMTNDWLTSSIDKIYKPFVTDDGSCYLMKPRARSRGIFIAYFEQAFCKIV